MDNMIKALIDPAPRLADSDRSLTASRAQKPIG